jgi:hypothetical protein
MAEEWEYDTRKKAEKVAAAITENTQNLGALIDSIHDEVQYNARERKKRIKENIETASSAFQKGLEDFMGIDDGQK